MVQGVGNNSNSRVDTFIKCVSAAGAFVCALGAIGIGIGAHLHSPSLQEAGYVFTAVGGAAALPGAYKAAKCFYAYLAKTCCTEENVQIYSNAILRRLQEIQSKNYSTDMKKDPQIKETLQGLPDRLVDLIKEEVLAEEECDSISIISNNYQK